MRGTGHAAYTDASVRTSYIFDDNWLTERHPHAFCDDPSEHIGTAAHRERRNHRDGPRRIGLCPCEARRDRQCRSARDQM
jgi:hypothetical protein